MRKYYFVFLLISIVFASDPARTSVTRSDAYLSLWPQGMDFESYNAGGFSDITQNQASDICSGNPATLTKFNSIAVGFSYDYSTEVPEIILRDESARRELNWYPNKIGIVFPFSNFTLGLAYHEKYKLKTDYGDIVFETMDGIKTKTHIFENKIKSFSGLVAFKFSDLIKKDDKFSVGCQYFLDTYSEDYNWDAVLELNGTKTTSSWKVGTMYSSDRLSLGLVYEKGYYKKGKFNYSGEYFLYIAPPTHYIGQLPDKLALGCNYHVNDKLSLATTITQVFWNYIDYYRNSLAFSVNGVYQLPNNIQTSVGIYNAQRYFDYSIFTNEFNSTNINLGVKIPYHSFQLIGKVSDSHLISSRGMKCTNFSLGIDYELK